MENETYQKVTGPLMANSHPGSYCGQDAYTDMFVTELVTMGHDERSAKFTDNGVVDPLSASDYKPPTTIADQNYAVRRLTPLECTRLQGFPDHWVDIGDWVDEKGKTHKDSDSAKYKALGNSIALPFWFWLMGNISKQYDEPAKLGSLFSGIGGFDICWEYWNGPDTSRWSSEIEQYPIAVMKEHFGDEMTGKKGDLWTKFFRPTAQVAEEE